jgi:hypothetical protein
MAKLVEELMVIKVSQMVKDNAPAEELLPPDAVSSFEITGNFVYLRARIDRSYIAGPPALNTVGTVDKILLNI